LDSDLIIQQFEQIEQRVESLIETCRKIEAENNELKNRVLTLEEELKAKLEMESRYQEEKSLVRNKIDGLLAKLDTIAEG
jgi:regulator of replication initiation timing